MMVAKKERKRIQPQLIFSPVKSASEQDAVAARAKRAMADLGSLKEHSEIAKKLLGPGRKIHVDLSFYQRKEKFVDWKEILKEHGIKMPKKGSDSGAQIVATKDLASKFGSGNQNAINPLARVIQKLERSVGVVNILGEGEAEDSSSEEEDIQDDENMEEAGDGSDSQGEDAPNGDGDATDTALQTGKELPGKEGMKNDVTGGKTERGKREYKNDYDYHDEWIDDTEYIEVLEKTDRRKSKYSGFFIAKGTLERREEYMPGAIPLKSSRNRRRGRDGSQQPSGTGAEDGIEQNGKLGEVDMTREPVKKRRRRRTRAEMERDRLLQAQAHAQASSPSCRSPKPLANAKEFSIAAFAAAKGAGAAAAAGAIDLSMARPSSFPEPIPRQVTKKEVPVYNMPADVSSAIERVLNEAKSASSFDTYDPSRPNRKQFPPNVLEALKAAMPLFGREYKIHKSVSSSYIVDKMYEVLMPFTTRENLRQYAIGGRVRHPVLPRAESGNPKPSNASGLATVQARPEILGFNQQQNHKKTGNGDDNTISNQGGRKISHDDQPVEKITKDNEFIAKAIENGASEEDYKSILNHSRTKYAKVLFRVLALMGKDGASTSTVAEMAVKLGLESWDPTSKTIKDGLSKATKDCKTVVARLQRNRYALTCFPGVEDHREENSTHASPTLDSRH